MVWNFICFFGRCCAETFEAFDHCILWFEIVALLAWWWFDYRKHTKDVVAEQREAKLRKRFRLACLLVLPFYILVIGPFNQFRESEHDKERVQKELTDLKNADQRKTKEEQGAANRILAASLSNMDLASRKQSKIILDLATSPDPIRAAVSDLAQPEPPLRLTDGKSLDLEAAKIELENVRARAAAESALSHMQAADAAAIKRHIESNSAVVLNYIAAAWIYRLTELATKNGDVTTNTYHGIPQDLEVKMQNNKDWDFRMSFVLCDPRLWPDQGDRIEIVGHPVKQGRTDATGVQSQSVRFAAQTHFTAIPQKIEKSVGLTI